MKPTDFATPELARAATLTTTRMISNSTMRLYLKAVGLYLAIHEIANGKHDTPELDGQSNPTGNMINHPAKEMCLLIVDSLAGSSTDDNDFNFIIGNAKGDGVIADTEDLRDNLLVEYTNQIDQLLQICKAHCNVVTSPFASITDQEHADAVAEQAAQGETQVGEMKYNTVLATDDTNIVNVAYHKYAFMPLLDAPALYDTEITVVIEARMEFDENGRAVFTELPDIIKIPVKQGTRGKMIRKSLASVRHLRVKSATIGLANTPFKLDIQGE